MCFPSFEDTGLKFAGSRRTPVFFTVVNFKSVGFQLTVKSLSEKWTR